MKKKTRISRKIAKRNNVKTTRKFNGKKYRLVDEVEPISSTPDMFAIKAEAKRQKRSVKFIYNKTNDTGLVYFSESKKNGRNKNARKNKRKK